MRNYRKTGAAAEQLAASFLEEHGVRIVSRNFRRGRNGEIDLVGRDQNTLVFVEVKYRGSEESGTPEEAVTFSKQRTICRTADYYRYRHRIPEDTPIRFDVVAIRRADEHRAAIHWIRNAFLYHI